MSGSSTMMLFVTFGVLAIASVPFVTAMVPANPYDDIWISSNSSGNATCNCNSTCSNSTVYSNSTCNSTSATNSTCNSTIPCWERCFANVSTVNQNYYYEFWQLVQLVRLASAMNQAEATAYLVDTTNYDNNQFTYQKNLVSLLALTGTEKYGSSLIPFAGARASVFDYCDTGCSLGYVAGYMVSNASASTADSLTQACVVATDVPVTYCSSSQKTLAVAILNSKPGAGLSKTNCLKFSTRVSVSVSAGTSNWDSVGFASSTLLQKVMTYTKERNVALQGLLSCIRCGCCPSWYCN